MPHIVFEGNFENIKFEKFKYESGDLSFHVVEIYKSKMREKVLFEVELNGDRRFIVEVKKKKDGGIIKVGSFFTIERDEGVKRVLWLIYKRFPFGKLIRTNIEEELRDG